MQLPLSKRLEVADRLCEGVVAVGDEDDEPTAVRELWPEGYVFVHFGDLLGFVDARLPHARRRLARQSIRSADVLGSGEFERVDAGSEGGDELSRKFDLKRMQDAVRIDGESGDPAPAVSIEGLSLHGIGSVGPFPRRDPRRLRVCPEEAEYPNRRADALARDGSVALERLLVRSPHEQPVRRNRERLGR